MAGTNLTFSKVVATPTPTAWSQAYSAGSLFAAISLQSETQVQTEEEKLGTLGKDLISTLESEFFTLENKDLETIKTAVATTVSRIDEEVKISFLICFLHENILYIYAAGGGKAVLKRGEKIGTVLEGEDNQNIKSASGYVQNGDVIVLQTKSFQRIIPAATLASSLDKGAPSEIAEEIAPHIHDKSEGGASAVILLYKEGVGEEIAESVVAGAAVAEGLDQDGQRIQDETSDSSEEVKPEEAVESEEPEESISNLESSQPTDEPIHNPPPPTTPVDASEKASPFLSDQAPKKKFTANFGAGKLRRLSRRRILILIIGIILIVLIIIGSVFALTNNNGSESQDFDTIYNEARGKYDEGQSLKDLNASLSQESFRQAQAILLENKDTFPQGSSEDQQIEELLVQVNQQLSEGGNGTSTSQAQEVDKSESQFLSVAIDNPDSTYFTQNEDFIYFLTDKGVARLDKGNSEEEAIIEKSWEEEGGIGVFGSNVYVLDKTDNIVKFVPSGNEFSQSNYITGNEPDLSDSVAMAVDGSIYVLKNDGSIQKYTRGAEENFSITGLEKPMSSPTRIVTAEEFDNIYVLDRGNSRIVVLDKEGKFVKAYSANILKDARDIDPQETNSAIYVLSDGKVYKIDIQ